MRCRCVRRAVSGTEPLALCARSLVEHLAGAYPGQICAHNRRRVFHDRVLAREVEPLAHLMREAIRMQSDVIGRARTQSEALTGSPS